MSDRKFTPNFHSNQSPITKIFIAWNNGELTSAFYSFACPCFYSDKDGQRALQSMREIYNYLDNEQLVMSRREHHFQRMSQDFTYLEDHLGLCVEEWGVWFTNVSDDDDTPMEVLKYAGILKHNGREWKLIHLMLLSIQDNRVYDERDYEPPVYSTNKIDS